jgi:hypothetical protein
MGWREGDAVVADLWLGEGGAAAAAQSRTSALPDAKTTPLVQAIAAPEQEQALLLSQILRLTTLIYNDFALFPMSFASRVRFHAAMQLYHLLFNNKGKLRILHLGPKFELWVYAMGAMACAPFHSPWAEHDEREVAKWFLDGLRGLVEACCGRDRGDGMGSVEDGVQRKREKSLGIIRGFLWWEHVMIRPLGDVWAELYPDDV